MARKKYKKAVVSGNIKTGNKEVPEVAFPDTNQDTFTWTAREIDGDVTSDETCNWSWDLKSSEAIKLLQFLDETSKKKWGEILSERTGNKTGHKKNHGQPITSLSKPAQERLKTVYSDLEEQIFRFRLSGTSRVWGFRSGATFRLIWWDPNHQVYPVD